MVASDQPDTGRLSVRVVDEVARATGTDPLDLPPIYHVIDSDALDSVVNTLESGRVEFRYAGQYVTIDGDETIRVVDEPDQGLGQAADADDD